MTDYGCDFSTSLSWIVHRTVRESDRLTHNASYHHLKKDEKKASTNFVRLLGATQNYTTVSCRLIAKKPHNVGAQ